MLRKIPTLRDAQQFYLRAINGSQSLIVMPESQVVNKGGHFHVVRSVPSLVFHNQRVLSRSSDATARRLLSEENASAVTFQRWGRV
jgi:hypothetical protein